MGALGSAEWKLVRIILTRQHTRLTQALVHKFTNRSGIPQAARLKPTNTGRHVSMSASKRVLVQGRDQTAGRCLTHKRSHNVPPVGALGSAEWKLVRIILTRQHTRLTQALLHKFTNRSGIPQAARLKPTNTGRHVSMSASKRVLVQGRDQTAGRCLTHKRFPQRTPSGSTRVCRMETCKDHPHTAARTPHTSSTSQVHQQKRDTARRTTQAHQHRTACQHVSK